MNKKGKNKSKKDKGESARSGNVAGSSKRIARIAMIGIVAGVAAVLALAIFLSGGFTKLASPSEQRAVLITQVLAPSTTGAGALESATAESLTGAAKVTIVEFGDYQCDSCARFHEETKDLVVTNLIETGKVKFMFKDFPINDRVYAPRDGSTLAAEAAYCAGDQGKFWQYHDYLYNNREEEGIEWISPMVLTQFASDVGVQDMEQFSNCLDSHQYRESVRANYRLAQQLGLNATPTFLVIAEGKEPQIIVGAHPFSSFQRVVDDLSSSS